MNHTIELPLFTAIEKGLEGLEGQFLKSMSGVEKQSPSSKLKPYNNYTVQRWVKGGTVFARVPVDDRPSEPSDDQPWHDHPSYVHRCSTLRHRKKTTKMDWIHSQECR